MMDILDRYTEENPEVLARRTDGDVEWLRGFHLVSDAVFEGRPVPDIEECKSHTERRGYLAAISSAWTLGASARELEEEGI